MKTIGESKKRLLALLTSILLFVLSSALIFQAMIFVEARNGALLNDLLHSFFPAPKDCSILIFSATYFAALVSLIACALESLNRLSFALSVYSSIVIFRSLAMLMVPLDPPAGMIPLIDPVITYLNPAHFIATRDLFFSGHTATLFFLFLIARPTWLKWLIAFLMSMAIFALLWQRVHYTIDIIGGMVAAALVVKGMTALFKKFELEV